MLGEGIYTLLKRSEDEVTIKLNDENHPLFQAHFPTDPILPGYIHFDIVEDLFDIKITHIKRAKFLKIIRPEEVLVYKRDNNKFRVYCEEKEVTSFVL